MKTKLTVSVDDEMIEFGKEYAASRGTSLSQLIEDSLRELQRSGKPSFSSRWKGKFSKRSSKGDPRMRWLEKRYG